MTKAQAFAAFRKEQRRHRSIGVRMDGLYCLACGEPLFGDELLHVRSIPRPSNLLDAIRWAGVMGNVA